MGILHRAQRSSHPRKLQVVVPGSFSRRLMLFGFALLVVTVIAFVSGPLVVSPQQRFPNSISQEMVLGQTNQVTRGYLDTSSSSESLWATKLSKNYYGCSEPSKSFLSRVSKSKSNGYLLVEASGGLNQQRTGIINAVVVAQILNATLVVPHLDHASFWKDNSNFSDIFDLGQFIGTVKPFVRVLQQLPKSMRMQQAKIIFVRVPRKCTPDYYRKTVLPILHKHRVIRLRQFDYRLSNRLDEDLQKLRCKVNYHALQFIGTIKMMGDMLVERLRWKNGRYIALHLRFEPDMLAFTGCYYGGGQKEIDELGQLRKQWKNIPHLNPGKARRNGRCPLTPQEVGFMLRALGFGSDAYLYVASGEIYGGEKTLAPLKAMFPNLYTKDTLATRKELQPFSAYASRMAAIDFIVCDESNVLVTNHDGNMARMLAGHRRYFGHKRTIRANAKKLGSLFQAKPNMTWDVFAARLQKMQKGFMGDPNEVRPGRGQFFENPSACICHKTARSKRHVQGVLQKQFGTNL